MLSDTTGALVLAGIFALAAIFALWNWRLRAGASRRLRALGFEPCAGEASALAAAWSALAAATGAPAKIRVRDPLRRAAGWGMLHHFDVIDETPRERGDADRASVDPTWPAYLLDLRDAESIHRAPVVLFVVKSDSRLFREMLRGLIRLAGGGAELELGAHAWSQHVIAAHAAAPGKLDEIVPPAVQQKISQAAEHGFFAVHLANGKAAFSVLPGARNVDREWAYLSQWC